MSKKAELSAQSQKEWGIIGVKDQLFWVGVKESEKGEFVKLAFIELKKLDFDLFPFQS